MYVIFIFLFFFFSSRRRHTRWPRDWSSDVCSSDLGALAVLCLVSTLAVADEMTCTAGDGKGNCTAAAGPDGKVIVVVGEGVKVGEQVSCVDTGYMINCIASPRK